MFVKGSKWLEGPSFLKNRCDPWERIKPDLGTKEVQSWAIEVQPALSGSPWEVVAGRLSSWHWVLRVAAKVLVAVRLFAWNLEKAKNKSLCEPITDLREEDFPVAENWIVRSIQEDNFQEDMKKPAKREIREC